MISFVVPAWNEALGLKPTLEALHAAGRASGSPYEIVVADDASSDATPDIARSMGARVETNHKRQIAGTRNAGARAALGDLIIFVDADTLVTPELVQATLKATRAGAVGGGCLVQFDYVPGYAKWALPFLARVYRKAGMAAGCYVFCTRTAFEASGGFDERFYAGEECEFSAKLRRFGRFELLRETVTTSGRKLRTYSAWEYFRFLVSMCLGGLPFKRDRKAMDFWYGERRQDHQPRLPSP